MKFVYCTFASPAICVLPPRNVREHPVYTHTHSLCVFGGHSVTLSSLSGQIFFYAYFRELHVGVGRAGGSGARMRHPKINTKLTCFVLICLWLYTHTHSVILFLLFIYSGFLMLFHLLSHCSLLLNSLYSLFLLLQICARACVSFT